MKTKEFINKLEENTDKVLLIEFTKEQYAGTNYHLTEVKNVVFSTVDCGGNINKWKETHLQIWESPREIGKEEHMTVAKVLSIINRVNTIDKIDFETEVKVEFGNEIFHTSVMKVSGFAINDKQLIVQLFTEKTLCKAPSVCGDEDGGGACSTTEEEVKQEESGCCESTGCC